jgi:hypothetical protein
MSAAEMLATHPADGPMDVHAETRQLIVDLRDAARDGRLLADRFASVLKATVEEYCAKFEARAEDQLARLEDAR